MSLLTMFQGMTRRRPRPLGSDDHLRWKVRDQIFKMNMAVYEHASKICRKHGIPGWNLEWHATHTFLMNHHDQLRKLHSLIIKQGMEQDEGPEP